jgi:hypothetical protein
MHYHIRAPKYISDFLYMPTPELYYLVWYYHTYYGSQWSTYYEQHFHPERHVLYLLHSLIGYLFMNHNYYSPLSFFSPIPRHYAPLIIRRFFSTSAYQNHLYYRHSLARRRATHSQQSLPHNSQSHTQFFFFKI